MRRHAKMSLRSLLVVCLMVCFIILVSACGPMKRSSPSVVHLGDISEQDLVFDHSHQKFDALLKKHVQSGWVDYKSILAQATPFYDYLSSLAAVQEHDIKTWTKEQRLTFWINGYNAFTIQAIIERYPITSRSFVGLLFPQNSILQIAGVWSELVFDIAGQRLTLDQIEHEILRKKFVEPRIHFAIVCASRSCPPLRSEAYRPDILERQLDDQTREFINDPQRGVKRDAKRKRISISKIFKWFKEDFTEGLHNVSNHTKQDISPLLAYIRPYYATRQLQDTLDVRVTYLFYDWRLNDSASKLGKYPMSPDNEW